MQIAVVVVSIQKSRAFREKFNVNDRCGLRECDPLQGIESRAAVISRQHMDRRDEVLTLNQNPNLIGNFAMGTGHHCWVWFLS